MKANKLVVSMAGVFILQLAALFPVQAKDFSVFEGKEGPGKGKHIVFLTGDEEYRSEEAMPMLAKIMAERHGFKCTVLYALNPTNGTIDPVNLSSIPGIAALDNADLCVMFLRFRQWPDQDMKHFVDYMQSGKPVVALRTSTHAFNYKNTNSPYAKYSFNSKTWPGGFGQQVLGETWVNHHGVHAKESSRAVANEQQAGHPILRGVKDIWGPSDVYTVTHLPKDATVLMFGQVLTGMNPTDPVLAGPKNNPMMPVAWIRNYTWETGKTSKVFTTTMGCAIDLENEGLRRLLANACYWAVGLEDKIPQNSNVDYIGEYKGNPFGFGKFKPGMKPE